MHFILTDDDMKREADFAQQQAELAQTKPYEGCTPRITVYGTCPATVRASDIFPRIPRDQWMDYYNKNKGTFLNDLTRDRIPVHNQFRTSLCWMHGSVRSLELLKIYEGQQPELLSAECAAFFVTGGRDRGGYPEEALEQLRTKGTCSEAIWPRNTLSDKTAKPGWEQELPYNVILVWMDVQNFDDQMTLAFHRVPVPIGISAWSHLVCQTGPVLLPNGELGIEFDNSWDTSWGDNGRGVFNERQGTADLGAFAPISATFQKRLERYLEIGRTRRH